MRVFKYILLFLCLVISLSGIAQGKKSNTKNNTKANTLPVLNTSDKEKAFAGTVQNSLQVITSFNEKSVKLRWALSSPIGWKDCNKAGFRVVRFTLKRDTNWLKVPEKKVLAEVYKPKPEAEWETLAKKDDYAAIVAQTLYGKDMQVDMEMKDGNPLTSIVNETQDLQQRYALSMLACDMSFEAAKLAAWGIEDTLVSKNERYLYRIIPLTNLKQVNIDSAYALVKMEKYRPLPLTGDPQVIFGDSMATISYNYFFLKDTYIAFHIERSDDKGKTYQQLTRTPVTGINEKKGEQNYQFYYADKLRDNTTEYSYRIKGVTSFSETGPASTAVNGTGYRQVSVYPHITQSYINENGHAEIEWEFDPKSEADIKGFQLERSKTNGGRYKVLQANISPKSRKLVVKKLENSNYFTITAIGKKGEKHTSPKRLLLLVDSIPPAPPEVISARVDTAGNVTLEWKANTEADLFGYKVFRANNEKEEPYPVTDTVYHQTVITEKLNASMGNRKIYYFVVALDKRYNQSKFSKRAEVERPDVTPPTSPIFTSYEVTKQGVKLTWGICQDIDVAKHVLLRKQAASDSKWEVIANFKDTTSLYIDKLAEPGKAYFYAIIAKDKSGLESPPLKPVRVNLPGDPSKMTVNSFTAVPDPEGNSIELIWETERKDVKQFELYKGEGEEPVTLWKVLAGDLRKIKDTIKPDLHYQYQIRMVMQNGTTGIFKQLNF